MKKIMILALSAMIAVGASAQEMRKDRGAHREVKKLEQRDVRQEARPEIKPEGKKAECLSGEKKDFVAFEIKNLARELYLDSLQEESFGKIYREFSAEREKIREEARKQENKLSEKYADKFAKVLNKRQVERVLRPEKPNCDKAPGANKHGDLKHGK